MTQPRNHSQRPFRNGANRLLLPSRQTELARRGALVPELIQLIMLRSIGFFSALPRPPVAFIRPASSSSFPRMKYEKQACSVLLSFLLIYIHAALTNRPFARGTVLSSSFRSTVSDNRRTVRSFRVSRRDRLRVRS